MTKGTSILIILVLSLLPVSAQAQDIDVPLFSPSANIHILYPLSGFVYFYDARGNSIIFYRQWSGDEWYSARDSTGGIVQEGYRVAPQRASDLHGMPPMNREAPEQDIR